MTTLRRLFRRLATTLQWGSADADLTREIDAHLQLLEDDFVKTGMTREDARYAARRAFGGVEQAKEQQRDERAFGWLAGWPTDLRLGARMLVKSPGLTVIAVSALAVAIGAGAAYLEFTRDVMHPTLPLANGERIVGIQIWNPERNAAETRVLADFVAWRDAADTIEFFGAARRVDAGVLTWWDDSLRVETIAYACALALLVALFVGVVPALKATGATLQGRLREAGAAVSTMRFGGVWTGVMITQVGITVIFLTTVASFGWGALRSRLDYDVIFKRDQFLTARLVKLHQAAGEPARLSQADYRAMADKATSQSGVANVTYVSELPGAIDPRWCGLELAPQAGSEIPLSDSPDLGSSCPRVGPNYFETMGIALVGGRLFSESEIENNHPVAIVDEAFVHTILGGRNALGMMVRERSSDGDSAQPWHEIIGVVQDVTIRQRKGPADAMVYRPATIASASPAQIMMRTHGAAAPVVGSLQSTQSADADVRLVDIKSLDQATAAGETGMRVLLRIVSVVAAVALLLSTAGIYALVSFTLTRRTREIGIRAALGAAPSRIVGSVLRRAVTQIGAGVLAGAVPSSVIMTYGVTISAGMGMARGVSATSVVCAFVILVATISCAAPLRRALRIDPTLALRTE